MVFNPLIAALLRSPLHGMLSRNTLVISYTGRKSGKRFKVPVNYVRKDGELLITSFRARTWWRSLVGGAPVRVLVRGKDLPARAEAVTDSAGVTKALGDYLRAAPSVAKYFNVRIQPDGQPASDDLDRAAVDRVVIRVRPGG